MTKYFWFVALAAIAISCSTTPENGYTIKGEIQGKVPSIAYLQHYTDGSMKTIDSSSFFNGSFTFTGELTEADYYYIRIGDERNLLGLFVENAEIQIYAHADSLNQAIISGSSIQSQYDDYKQNQLVFKEQLSNIYSEYKQTNDEAQKAILENKYDSVDHLSNLAAKEYVIEINTSPLAPYIIRRELIYGMDLSELEEITNKLSPELKENKYTKQLYKHIETLRNLQPGMQAPAFTQNDADGNPVSLDSFKGKYVLIDFWASWCAPCRAANPTVVSIYKKYSAKNFTVLGISMDSNKDKWLEAIEEDGLTWTHISSLEGWKNPIAKQYAVNSIPHAILLDPEGKVVKRGIHAGDLDELLATLIE